MNYEASMSGSDDRALELSSIDTPEKRKERGAVLAKRHEAWMTYIEGMNSCWTQVEKLMRNDPEKPSDAFWNGFIYRHIPMLAPKARAWLAYVCSSPLEANPYFVGTMFGKDATRASEIEQDFYLFMKKAHFDRYFRLNAQNCGMYGKGIWRVRPYMEKGKPCFGFDAVWPRCYQKYPNTPGGIESLLNIGHTYEERAGEIKQKQTQGYYYSDETVQGQSSNDSVKEVQGRLDDSKPIAEEDENKPVTVAEWFDKFDYDGTGEKWWRVRFIPSKKVLLAVYSYPFSRPWYFEMWVHEEPDRAWPETSRFNDVKDLQYAKNENWNLMSAGSQMAAFGSHFASGWALDKKYSRPAPGTVTPILQGGQVTSIQSNYDPSVMPLLDQSLDKQTDLTMRLGAQAQGGEASYDKTATGAQIRKLAVDVSINDDLAAMDYCMSEIAHFMQEVYRDHYPTFLRAYGDALAVQPEMSPDGGALGIPEVLMAEILWELNGKSPANTPQAQADAAVGLVNTLAAFNPQNIQMMMMAGVDWKELLRSTVTNSILDNRQQILNPDPQKQMQDAQELNNSGLIGGMAQSPGMGMAPNGGIQPGQGLPSPVGQPQSLLGT